MTLPNQEPLRLWRTTRFLAALAVSLSATAAQPEVVVETRHDGDAYVVTAHAQVDIDATTAWQVVTGYDRYATFVPGLNVSRTLERDRGHAIVEQRGEFRFMGLRVPLEVKYAVTEHAPHSVESRAIAGSFREATGRYELESKANGTRISYSGRLVPGFLVPTFLGISAIRTATARQFAAMVEELERHAESPLVF